MPETVTKGRVTFAFEQDQNKSVNSATVTNSFTPSATPQASAMASSTDKNKI